MTIRIANVETYDRDAVKAAVTAAMADWGGLAELLAGRERIWLKPNLLVPEGRDRGSTTHPEFYLAVAELLLDLGKQVTIGDSPAFGSAWMCLRAHGALAECHRLGINVMTPRRSRSLPGIPGHPHFARLSIAAALDRFEALVNLPKLKVHGQFVFTGATKNLFGLVIGKRKAFRHFHCGNSLDSFARMILITAAAAKPIINLGDGVQALHRNGPRNGELYPLHTVVASDSCLEHDWYFARRIGLNPEDTPLFQVVAPELRETVAAACRPVLETPDFAVAPDFQLAPPNPIAFTFSRVIRSVWKSLRTRSPAGD